MQRLYIGYAVHTRGVCAIVLWRSYGATAVVINMRRVCTGHILIT